MKRWITKHEILDLVKGKTFNSEDEFRDYIAPKIALLFKVKDNQISTEPETTSFDGTLSNRADIVVQTDDNFHKALVVIELKLVKSIEKFYGGSYEAPRKQLHKYCQDTRAPFGILLTEESCFIYKNKYFSYNQIPKRELADRIPCIEKIEDIVAFYALIDFLLYKKSSKYLLWIFLGLSTFFIADNAITKTFGLGASMIVALVVGIVTTGVLFLLAFVFKIFD